MKTRASAAIVVFVMAAAAIGAQQKPAAPQVPSVSKRPNGGGLATIRMGAPDSNMWFGWRVAAPMAALRGLTFSDALTKADVWPVASVEASSVQVTAFEVPKALDHRLQANERAAVVYRLREIAESIAAYRVDQLGADAAMRRRVFEFAKSINVPLIITSADAANLAELDTLAEEFEINVALESTGDPKTVMAALEGRGKRMGVSAHLGEWAQAGVKAVDGLDIVKGKLLHVTAADRSGMNARARVVALGEGAVGLGDFFLAAYRAGLKPLTITVESTGTTEADMVKNLHAFERVMWRAMAARVNDMLKTPAGQIRGGDRLPADMRAQIDAAIPRQAPAKPARPRKLLVTDIQMYSGHATIPHGNYMIELMAKYTGAFEPTFSNDPDMLKYPKIKEFDAVFFNNVCGMVHNDPEVRGGILRFVREGGGLGGNHAVTYANLNWPEFAEMMGGWAGQHRVEEQVLKIDDPSSPLMKPFGTEPFTHTDEFYIFPPYSPYSREKQRVLMSIDVDKSDRGFGGRFSELSTRPDQDYGVAWVKGYGKGRTYFTPLGHTTIMYTDKRWTAHLLAAIQYLLGDIEHDETPSAKARKTN
ncbi:MAG TPA: ThuA domain-containing protein [Vicinamibacterales bacterium]|nr:ThuA domain-containing protein [Vicinamibacterales bacterium]